MEMNTKNIVLIIAAVILFIAYMARRGARAKKK